uniref:Uncharacterized protein n=1 Tax=Globodera pallida TaxID=36090 RepID=A0A183CKY9_GLOPA
MDCVNIREKSTTTKLLRPQQPLKPGKCQNLTLPKSLLKINDVLNLTKYRQLSTTLSNWLWIICLGFSCRDFALMLISLIHSTQLCGFYRFSGKHQKDLLFANPHSPRSIGCAISFAFSSPASPNLIRLVQISPQLHAILSAILAPCHTFFETITHQTLNFLRHFLHALLSLCHYAAQLGSTVVHSLSPEGVCHQSDNQTAILKTNCSATVKNLLAMQPTPLSVICIRFLAFSSASDKFLCSPAKRICKFCVLMDGADGPAERQRCNLAAGLLEYDIELVD